MAFGSNPLWRFEGTGVNHTHRIDIYQDGVSPTSSQIEELYLEEYPVLTRGEELNHITEVLLPGELELNVFDYNSASWGYLYDRLRAAGMTDIRVDYYRDGNLRYRGLAYQYQTEHPANHPEFSLPVTVTDGFQALKTKPMDLTARKTIDTLAHEILSVIGHNMNYRFFMDWEEDNATNTFLPHNLIINPNYYLERYPDASYLDYLRQLLFDWNFQLYQEDGRWIFRQLNNDDEEADPTAVPYYEREARTSSTGTGTVNMVESLANADLYESPTSDVVQHTPVVKLGYDISKSGEGINNGRFENWYWDYDLGRLLPESWSYSGDISSRLLKTLNPGHPLGDGQQSLIGLESDGTYLQQTSQKIAVNGGEGDSAKLIIRYEAHDIQGDNLNPIHPILELKFTSAVDGTEYWYTGERWETTQQQVVGWPHWSFAYDGKSQSDAADYIQAYIPYDITPPDGDRGYFDLKLLGEYYDGSGNQVVDVVNFAEASVEISVESTEIPSTRNYIADFGAQGEQMEETVVHGDESTWTAEYPVYIYSSGNYPPASSWGGMSHTELLARKIAEVNKEKIGVLRGQCDMGEGVDLTQRWSYDGRTYKAMQVKETLVTEDVELIGYTIDPDETGLNVGFRQDYGTSSGNNTAVLGEKVFDIQSKQRQQYENTQITTTTSDLSGTITSIPVNSIDAQILDSGDPVSIVDKETGLVHNFTMASDQQAGATSLSVNSSDIEGYIVSGSYVVFTGSEISSAIVKLDDAIALKAPKVFVDADVMQDQDWNGSVDSNGNITDFASAQTSPNKSWAITGQGHFEFTDGNTAFRYNGNDFEFLLSINGKIKYGSGLIDYNHIRDGNWNGELDNSGNITTFASDQSSPNSSWAITKTGHFEFTDGETAFRYDGGNFEFVLGSDGQVKFGSSGLTSQGINIQTGSSYAPVNSIDFRLNGISGGDTQTKMYHLTDVQAGTDNLFIENEGNSHIKSQKQIRLLSSLDGDPGTAGIELGLLSGNVLLYNYSTSSGTEAGWISVEIGGTTYYLRLFASQ